MEKACHTEPGKTRIARSVQQIPSLIEQNYHYRRDMYALRASRLGLMVNILDVNAQPNAANRAIYTHVSMSQYLIYLRYM